MQKVLIIAYFFPPCNLTASARPAAWAKYLGQFGYYPIVVTRNWDIAINKPSDISKTSGEAEKKVEDEQSTVYYLPYKASLKDKIYAEHGDNKYRLLRKALSFFEVLFQNFFLSAVPFSNFYDKAVELIEKNKDLNRVVITANPFVSFFIGYRLKKKFPHIKWVADYRDDWSTSDINVRENALAEFIFKLENRSEKKWVGTAAIITTISSFYAHKISKYVGVKATTLLNGFTEDDLAKVKEASQPGELAITYNGTLYPTQSIEPFLEGFKKAVDAYGEKLKFKLYFPGLAYYAEQANRVRSNMQGYGNTLEITERIPRAQVFDIQNRSHAFLMVSHNGIKGIPSSKLYEYLCFRKPVILCPNDGDIVEQTLNDTNTGIICNTADEVFKGISQLAEDILKHGRVTSVANEERVMSYSRKNQAKVLAEILNGL
ncbi:MAG TPA: hypothetical protein VK174_03275 [Chitinophagales bacterium]|nr:hypothetical protein [Chitinophagales bacterium]